MTPTEKHREIADDVYDDLARGHDLDGVSRHDVVLAFAFAIARAEREGMKRAAEMARNSGHWESVSDESGKSTGETRWRGLNAKEIADVILSEIGEGLSYSQSGLSYSDARSE